ncbi:uncharacterized protein EV420DRAFT_1633949 [Desarmillaria tabescens]|uniref:Uncharacterized protein n=1 Tax=Armillaria tabescens TaxID=1929756 RepID=A0AA39T7C2_ARMTA|nr:uncharacterized protein EV420DRAFT_1633949 [Desarmillaria tabescens]KAK0469526.1 hypothetical protein EV420DRAFT_1633949 [Desarmillaria tabescens]
MLLSLIYAFALFSAVFSSPTSLLFSPTSAKRSDLSYEPPAARGLTNAVRLARGYPLKAPVRRSDTARRGVPSSVPSGSYNPSRPARGYLQFTTSGGQSAGFIGTQTNQNGDFLLATGNSDKLLVEIDLMKAKSGPTTITTVNGGTSVSYVAGIVGSTSASNNLSQGSFSYFYFGGSSDQSGAYLETSIFAYSATDNSITVQWANSDGSTAETFIGLTSQGAFGTGDRNACEQEFGTVTWVTLSFVPQ